MLLSTKSIDKKSHVLTICKCLDVERVHQRMSESMFAVYQHLSVTTGLGAPKTLSHSRSAFSSIVKQEETTGDENW